MFRRLFSSRVVSPLFQAAVKDSTVATRAARADKQIPIFSTGNMHVSPQKLNHLARMIKGMSIDEAKTQMKFVLKRRGVDVFRMLKRASAALKHNYGVNPEQYFIKTCWVGKGTYLKRIRIHGRGRFGKMTRPRAHLKIKVEKIVVETPEEKEISEMVRRFKKRNLFFTMHDSRPIYSVEPLWSPKSFKYITREKWIDSKNALKRKS